MEGGKISLEREKEKPAFLSKWTSNPITVVLGFCTGVFSAGDWEAVCHKPGEWQHASVQAERVRNGNIHHRGTKASYVALGRGSNLLLVARSELLPPSVPVWDSVIRVKALPTHFGEQHVHLPPFLCDKNPKSCHLIHGQKGCTAFVFPLIPCTAKAQGLRQLVIGCLNPELSIPSTSGNC